MKLISKAFRNGEQIPEEYTDYGADISPPLKFVSVAPLAQSLVLIVEKPNPDGRPFVHWILVNIPPLTIRLESGLGTLDIQRMGAKEVTNSFGTRSYGGPNPSKPGTYEYRFNLYALNTFLNMAPHARYREVMDAMEDHVVQKAQLIGKYTKE